MHYSGEEIDAAIILPNNIVVIELKTGSGRIVGSENGDWVCEKGESSSFVINKVIPCQTGPMKVGIRHATLSFMWSHLGLET
ncbi:MAG: NERD domain-containing protein [Candidatus Cloacimonetes bacterium]|nr:NERD domain-containing protein [Candidatus Cloacimonadota bacterium]